MKCQNVQHSELIAYEIRIMENGIFERFVVREVVGAFHGNEPWKLK